MSQTLRKELIYPSVAKHPSAPADNPADDKPQFPSEHHSALLQGHWRGRRSGCASV